MTTVLSTAVATSSIISTLPTFAVHIHLELEGHHTWSCQRWPQFYLQWSWQMIAPFWLCIWWLVCTSEQHGCHSWLHGQLPWFCMLWLRQAVLLWLWASVHTYFQSLVVATYDDINKTNFVCHGQQYVVLFASVRVGCMCALRTMWSSPMVTTIVDN